MPSKNEGKNRQPVIDKRTREKIKKEVYAEINEDIKKEVAQNVINDVELMMDVDYKNDLKERVTAELIEDIKEDVKSEQKRIYRSKNFKIFRMYIYIILLLAAAVFMIYKLYVNGDLDILDKITTKADVKTTVTTTKEVKDLAYYMTKYGNILDNVVITDVELVKGSYNLKDVSITTKLAMAYKTVSSNDIAVDGIINKISAETIEKAYVSIFGSKDDLIHQNFSVDGINFAYSTADNQYVAVVYNNKETKVVNSITNIYEENDKLVVEAYTAAVINNGLYNVTNTTDKVKDYVEGENISSLKDKLTKVTYKFKNINGKYYLESIN